MIIVKENTVRFLERFGKLTKTLEPGLHFYIPLVYSTTKVISLKEHISELDHQKVITKDNVEIDIDGNFFYKVSDPQKAFYNAQDYVSAIQGLSTSVSRAEIGKLSLDQIFQNRKELNDRIKEAINESTQHWGVECLSYEILKIEPPQKIKEALREVAIAERLRRREVIISEAEREYNFRVSKAKKDAQIIVSEAKFEGECIINNKHAEAFRELHSALARFQAKESIINFVILESYLEEFKKILRNNKVFMLPESGANGDTTLLLSTLLTASQKMSPQKDATQSAQTDQQKLSELIQKLTQASEFERQPAEASKPLQMEEVVEEKIGNAQSKAVNSTFN